MGFECKEPVPRIDREPPTREDGAPERKRREYSKVQELYYRDKAEALKYIVDREGYIERSFPSQPIRQAWREYFEHNPGLDRVADGS